MYLKKMSLFKRISFYDGPGIGPKEGLNLYHPNPSKEDQSLIAVIQIVGINAETVTNVTSTDFPGHYPGEDNSWSLKKFERVPTKIPPSPLT